MQDVTRLMNNYRECSRNIWNTYFAEQEDWCCLGSRYDQIRKLLFESLVLAQLKEEQRAGSEVSPILKVVPYVSASVRIRRPSKDGVYWDAEPGLQYEESEISLEFVDYYDYFEQPVRDFRYYRCSVLKFPRHPEYERRAALVDIADAKVFYDG